MNNNNKNKNNIKCVPPSIGGVRVPTVARSILEVAPLSLSLSVFAAASLIAVPLKFLEFLSIGKLCMSFPHDL